MDDVLRYWPLLAGTIGATIWFVRLEASHMILKNRFEAHCIDNKERDKEMWKKLDALLDAVNNMSVAIAEIKSDLKHHQEN